MFLTRNTDIGSLYLTDMYDLMTSSGMFRSSSSVIKIKVDTCKYLVAPYRWAEICIYQQKLHVYMRRQPKCNVILYFVLNTAMLWYIKKWLRFFFAGSVGDIQRLKMRYASEFMVPNERLKEKVWRGFVHCYWDLKPNLGLQNNLWSLDVKCGRNC